MYNLEYVVLLYISKQLTKITEFDLIMMGATGFNAVERLIGSAFKYVIRNAS